MKREHENGGEVSGRERALFLPSPCPLSSAPSSKSTETSGANGLDAWTVSHNPWPSPRPYSLLPFSRPPSPSPLLLAFPLAPPPPTPSLSLERGRVCPLSRRGPAGARWGARSHPRPRPARGRSASRPCPRRARRRPAHGPCHGTDLRQVPEDRPGRRLPLRGPPPPLVPLPPPVRRDAFVAARCAAIGEDWVRSPARSRGACQGRAVNLAGKGEHMVNCSAGHHTRPSGSASPSYLVFVQSPPLASAPAAPARPDPRLLLVLRAIPRAQSDSRLSRHVLVRRGAHLHGPVHPACLRADDRRRARLECQCIQGPREHAQSARHAMWGFNEKFLGNQHRMA